MTSFENIKIKPQFNYENRIVLESNLPLNSPLVIYIEPSSYCNLECKFCPQHTGKGEFPKFNMSVDKFEKVLLDISNFDSKPKLMRFCGIGDPLFNKNIDKILELANNSNAIERTELITNGLLLNDNLIKCIAKNVGRIVISVEGLSNYSYKEFTLRNINFEKFLDNISKLYNYADRNCIIHIKIHNQAVPTDDLKNRFFELFKNISDEIYIENLVDLWPEKKSNLGINEGHRFEKTTTVESKVCPQIFKSMQVNADGRVLPCCVDWKSLNVIGDTDHNSLLHIWNDKPIRDLQRKHLMGLKHTFSPCKGCSHNEYSEKDNLDNSSTVLYEKFKSL
jgi:radical SAM protein with 4Fe4S-binding SPASM domain